MMAMGPSPKSTTPWNNGRAGMGTGFGGGRRLHHHHGIAVLGEQHLLRDVVITGRLHRLSTAAGASQGGARHGRMRFSARPARARALLAPFAAQMHARPPRQRQQRQVRQ